MENWTTQRLRTELHKATQLRNELIAKGMDNLAEKENRKIERISDILNRRGV